MPTGTKILLSLLFIAIGIVASIVVFIIPQIVALILLSILFSYIMGPAVNGLEGMGLHRTLAALIVFILFFGGIGLTVYNLWPLIYEQFMHLQEKVSLGDVQDTTKDFERWLRKYLRYFGVRKISMAARMEQWITGILDNAVSIASGVLGIVIFIVMLLISTFFMIKDGRKLRKQIIAIVPNQFFEMTLSIMHKIDWSIGAYLRGILLDAVIIGTLTTITMWAIGVPNYVLIGMVAGSANLVPYLGPPTAMIIASSFHTSVTATPLKFCSLSLCSRQSVCSITRSFSRLPFQAPSSCIRSSLSSPS